MAKQTIPQWIQQATKKELVDYATMMYYEINEYQAIFRNIKMCYPLVHAELIEEEE
mgnify:CR=1 FL=1|tara:strand:- start:337 stop:504 length:168 start_codon:yes stop_codon:yes gene_type:complete